MQKMIQSTVMVIAFIFAVFAGAHAAPALADTAPAIYLVRHAEKLTDSDPGLTEKGEARAQALAHLMQQVDLTAVYSTPYKRTLMTAAPSAKDAGVTVTQYDPRALKAFAEDIKAAFLAKPQSTLIVGHSNTTPVLVNFLTGASYPMLNEDEYSHLFVVRATGDGLQVTIQYFEPDAQ